MLRRLTLAALVCLTLLGIAAAVVWHWVRVDHTYREPQIEKALGWKLPKGGYVELRQMVARDPLPVLQLLAHDSKRVRRWAEQVLVIRNGADSLNDDLLDLVSVELNERDQYGYRYEKPALIRVLASAGERGAKRLLSLYRSKRPVEPILHLEICTQVERAGSRHELIDALLAVVKDDAVTLENRCRAVEALGHMNKPDGASGTTKAVEAAIATLTGRLPHLPEPVASAARDALQKIERGDGDRDEFYYPGDGHVVSPTQDGGADALAALKDKTDWLRVGRAAEELARHGMKQAIPDLQQVATTHWYGPVRKTAQQAVRVLQGEVSALPVDDSSRWSSLVMKFEEEEFAAWRKDHPDISPPPRIFPDGLYEAVTEKLKPARQAIFWRLQPRINNVEYRVPGRLPMPASIAEFGMTSMKPRHAIRYAGGKLLGYDEGEFGAGTVFYRKGETPLLFSTANVQGFIRAPFGVLVVCDVAMVGDGLLYLASEEPDGRVSVTFFMRLPSYSGWPTLLPSGETRIGSGAHGDIVISTTGEIRRAEPSTK